MSRQFARWDGAVYRSASSSRDKNKVVLKPLPDADPPADAAEISTAAVDAREVDIADLAEWWSSRTVFSWRGKDFVLIRDHGDRVSGTLLGADDAWAAANGLHVVERGHANGTFDRADVEDVHDEHTDLLARWRARRRREAGTVERAVWRGRVFAVARTTSRGDELVITPLPGEAPPDEFAPIPGLGVAGLEVTPDDLDEWWSARTVFTWRGRTFVLIGDGDDGDDRDDDGDGYGDGGDTVHGELRGFDAPWAVANGLWIVEPGFATGTFDRADAEDVHDERTDLLARWRHRTGRSPNATQRARWHGRVFSVAPSSSDRGTVLLTAPPGERPPDEFGPIAGSGIVGLEVTPDDLDEWWSTRTLFTWRGRVFTLVRDDGDTVHGEIRAAVDEWAEDNGLRVVEPGLAIGVFDRSDIENVRDERTDLLAIRRARPGGNDTVARTQGGSA